MFDKQAQFNYTVFQKMTTIFMVVILSNVNRFSQLFHC